VQLVELIRGLRRDALVVVAGDFNVPRGSSLYHDFVAAAGVLDTMADTRAPTYRPPARLSGRYAQPIDFVFIRPPDGAVVQAGGKPRFPGPFAPGGRTAPLPDPFGVEVRLEW